MERLQEAVMDTGNEFGINMSDTPSDTPSKWNVFKWHVPRSEVVFFTQVILIYAVVITSLVNLTSETSNPQLWTALLTGHLGYLLPNPTLRRK